MHPRRAAVDNGNSGDADCVGVAPARAMRLNDPILRRWETIAFGSGNSSRLSRDAAAAEEGLDREIGPRSGSSEIARCECAAAVRQERPLGKPSGLFRLGTSTKVNVPRTQRSALQAMRSIVRFSDALQSRGPCCSGLCSFLGPGSAELRCTLHRVRDTRAVSSLVHPFSCALHRLEPPRLILGAALPQQRQHFSGRGVG
ncbi:hypothetical protein ACVIIV_005490 [Bradyrhizobium sp. USDA 4354]